MSYVDCRSKNETHVRAFAARVAAGCAILVDDAVAVAVGHMLDGVPVITDPDAVVVFPAVVVDLDAFKLARIDENSACLWAHVEALIDADEQKALIATRLRVLTIQAAGGTPNAEAVAALDAMQAWIDGCMMTSALLSATVSMASTVEEAEAIVPDLGALPAPLILTAGALTFMLYAAG